MTRRDMVILAVAVLILGGFVTVTVKGGVKNTSAQAKDALKAGLADATSGQAVHSSSPWDRSADMACESNSWTAPPWEMAKVGVIPLRRNHPLHARPEYAGCNRDIVIREGWNGWYYGSPANEVL